VKGCSVGEVKYPAANRTIALLDLFRSLRQRTRGLESHGYGAAVTGAVIGFCFFNGCCGLWAGEGMWCISRFESCAIVTE